jgi:GNAT superfamily N-acetyltransferase
MAEIEAWLDAEAEAYRVAYGLWESSGHDGYQPIRGFRCNWDVTLKRWRDGNDRVDVLTVAGAAVAFLSERDILEVTPELRGLGYGRLLAQFMVDLAYAQGASVIEIGIAPPTAEPFWKSMGFTTDRNRVGSGGGIYAYHMLDRTFDLSDGERVPFSVDFFTQQERHADDPKPFLCFSGAGERLADGSLQLPERVTCFDPAQPQHIDYFVRIGINGQTIYFDKVKYPESKALGVERDPGYTYFVDRITSPEPAARMAAD